MQDEIISILEVTKALRYYSGDYYCIVKNEKGKTQSLPAYLQVKGNSCNTVLCCLRVKFLLVSLHVFMYIYICISSLNPYFASLSCVCNTATDVQKFICISPEV